MDGRGGSASRCYVLEVPQLSKLASAHQMDFGQQHQHPQENLQGLISFMMPSHEGPLLPSTNTLPLDTHLIVSAAAYNSNSKTWCNEEVCKRDSVSFIYFFPLLFLEKESWST